MHKNEETHALDEKPTTVYRGRSTAPPEAVHEHPTALLPVDWHDDLHVDTPIVSSPPTTVAPVRTGLLLVNLGLIAAMIGVSVNLWLDTSGVLHDYREAKRQRQACRVFDAAPPTVEVPDIPPQDRISKRQAYIGPAGIQRNSMMMLELEQVEHDSTKEVRLASPEVLQPNTIHVINLWAPFCEPCKREFPEFKHLFERRQNDWGGKVRFVPIKVQDDTPPATAYEQFSGQMPATDIQLADRSRHNDLITDLMTSTTDKDALSSGTLPVTLVLDCNRRVRWRHSEELTPKTFEDLEVHLDKMFQELGESGPGAWCEKPWCGNGRCDPGERRGDDFCAVDCGPPPRVQARDSGVDAIEPGSDTIDPVETAPRVWKLKGAPKPEGVKPEQPKTGCGDGVCDENESAANCCRDCPCAGNRVCQADAGGVLKCLTKLKL